MSDSLCEISFDKQYIHKSTGKGPYKIVELCHIEISPEKDWVPGVVYRDLEDPLSVYVRTEERFRSRFEIAK